MSSCCLPYLDCADTSAIPLKTTNVLVMGRPDNSGRPCRMVETVPRAKGAVAETVATIACVTHAAQVFGS
jgi:hypothetical protein